MPLCAREVFVFRLEVTMTVCWIAWLVRRWSNVCDRSRNSGRREWRATAAVVVVQSRLGMTRRGGIGTRNSRDIYNLSRGETRAERKRDGETLEREKRVERERENRTG